MISAGDFRNGVTVEIDGNVCQIVRELLSLEPNTKILLQDPC